MILVLYAQIQQGLSDQAWDRYFQQMSVPVRERISRYRRWEDRQAGLFGKLLLIEGLRRLGYPAEQVGSLVWDASGRPFLDGEMDFNISHSEAYVVCAVSPVGRVGIDIEKIRPIAVADFERQMTRKEWEMITASERRLESFFRVWTQKEAVTKADGRGISIPLDTVVIDHERSALAGSLWHLKEIRIADGYCCHLASHSEGPEVRLERICL